MVLLANSNESRSLSTAAIFEKCNNVLSIQFCFTAGNDKGHESETRSSQCPVAISAWKVNAWRNQGQEGNVTCDSFQDDNCLINQASRPTTLSFDTMNLKQSLKLFLSLAFVVHNHNVIGSSPEDDETRALRGLMYGHGHGYGGGGMGTEGNGQGGGGNGSNMQVIHKLLDNREEIERKVTPATEEEPLKTVTTSVDPDVAGWIKQHVIQMTDLAKSGGRIRNWDPLFEALFDNSEDLDYVVNEVNGGVEVQLKAWTDCAKGIAEKHAGVVSDFIKYGHQEVELPHSAPEQCTE
jgi:hypothetical protein